MQSPFCSLTTGFGNKDRDFEFFFLVIIDFQAGEEVQWCPSELWIAVKSTSRAKVTWGGRG